MAQLDNTITHMEKIYILIKFKDSKQGYIIGSTVPL